MAATGQNKGFHVLDEFVCEAVHAPSVPQANPAHQGRNQGMSIVEELVFEAGKAPASEDREDSDKRREPDSAAPDDSIKSEAKRLAALLAASADPLGAVTLFQKSLFVELASMQNDRGSA